MTHPALTPEKRIAAELRTYDGKMSVYADDLRGGVIEMEADELFETASTIKTFLLAALFDRVARGEASLTDELTYREDEYVSGSGVIRDLAFGSRMPVYNLAVLMITVSDNASANTLTGLLGGGDAAAGMAAVNAWAASAGYAGVEFNRLMLDNNGLQNYVTAESCAAILRDIYRGRCVSEEASGKMLELLKDQQVNDRIPAGVPAGTASAHKTGNLAGLCVADVGIVFTEGGDFLLCAICNRPYTDAGATAEIAKLAGMAYAAFAGAA